MGKVLWQTVQVRQKYVWETYTAVDKLLFKDICDAYGLRYKKLKEDTKLNRLAGAHTLMLDIPKMSDDYKKQETLDAELERLRSEFDRLRNDSFRIAERIQELLGEN